MSRKPADQDNSIREIRKQLNEQQSCFDFRTESKLSLLAEMRDFFKKRGEAELEYAKNLERICERFEKSTKQRTIKNEVRSTFNLWSTLLAETRRMARDRASLAETIGLELVARIEIMARDVNFLSRKCKDLCVEVQETCFKDLKELNEQTKVYQYACHHSAEAHNKLVKSREKVDAVKNSSVRKKKAEEKEKERLRQYNEQKHRQLKSRNEYLLKVCAANSRVSQYFGNDVMDMIELMDTDYHDSFNRLALAYRSAEQEACQQVMKVTTSIVDQTQALNFENDLHYFLSGFASTFTQPSEFNFIPFGDDDVHEYKVNTKDVFLKAQEMAKNMSEEVQTLKLQKEGDIRTIEHVNKNNLRKYRVQTIDDAIAVLEEMGDAIPPESLGKSLSLERGSLVTNTRAVQALHASQKGKDDTLTFTLGAIHRKLVRGSQQQVFETMLNIVEKSLSEQKVPPISIGGDYRIPKLFSGDCLEYIMATGCVIPLIIQSCCSAIEKEGSRTEGLFRVPGPAQQIDDLKRGFEEGRDPLMYSSLKGIEITAVASVLKLYFRELSNPLFPCEKYYQFISCTRTEDPQERIELLRDTINELHPAIVTVMRYLFRFLYKLSLLASETKMTSANLALVFGPTLTRAPDTADPRLLHNDVPAINVLIQLCIERFEYLFGPDAEEEGLSSPPPPPEAPIELDIILSPPPVKETTFERNDTPDSFIDTPPPPPLEDDTTLYQYPPDDTTEEQQQEPPIIPSREDKPVYISEDTPPEDTHPIDTPPEDTPPEDTHPEYLYHEGSSLDQSTVTINEPHLPSDETTTQEIEEQTAQTKDITPPKETTPPNDTTEIPPSEHTTQSDQTPPNDSMTAPTINPQVSTSSITNFLEQAFEDINAQIDSMKKPSSVTKSDDEQPLPPSTEEQNKMAKRKDSKKMADDEDEDGDSDSDSEEVMTITAKALYDYSARNEKELSFEKGCALEVIEKTPDGNWWDGYYNTKRGYIPVSYVEIADLQSVPVPPARKSSMQKGEEQTTTVKDNLQEVPEETTPIVEETMPIVDDITPEVKSVSSIKKDGTEPVKPPTAVKTGTVSKLTQQFQSPTHATPTQPTNQPTRVLFTPHKRVPSTDLSSKGGSVTEGLSRSGSGGSKSKPVVPPPIRPKPDKDTTPIGASPFPLMSHDAGGMVSPLQQAHLQQVVGGATKKPPAAIIKRSRDSSRSSGKGKKTAADKPPLATKPKPGGFELQAELAAATRRRKQEENNNS